MEGHPAGGKDGQPGTGEQQLAQPGGGGIEHVLEVVEVQEQVARPERGDEGIRGPTVGQAAGASDGRRHLAGILECRQQHGYRPVGVVLRDLGHDRLGEPGLADPAGTGQGQQSHLAGIEQRPDPGQVVLPPIQGRRHPGFGHGFRVNVGWNGLDHGQPVARLTVGPDPYRAPHCRLRQACR